MFRKEKKRKKPITRTFVCQSHCKFKENALTSYYLEEKGHPQASKPLQQLLKHMYRYRQYIIKYMPVVFGVFFLTQ